MDIDADISNWILEFLLKQPLEDRTIDALLRILPLPSNNNNNNNNPHHLPKSILLKCLDSQLSSISEKALGLLEQLEEIESSRGVLVVSDSMKHAYCAVALECTVKHLVNGSSTFEFFDAVDKGWRKRIRRMEEVLLWNGGLCSEERWAWRDAIEEAAVCGQDNVCETLLNKSASLNALEAVSIYLKEERDKIGPSFLEVAAEDVQMLGLGLGLGVAGKGKAPSTPVANLNESTTAVPSPQAQAEAEAEFYDVHEIPAGTGTGPSHMNFNLKANKIREDLELSLKELRAVVKDPLPDALHMADEISSEMAARNVRTSPLEKNCTTNTHEWEESIDISPEDPGKGRFHLPSPKDIHISPLVKYDTKFLKERRKKRKWSAIEEDSLRTGVEKYGRGKWKVILNAYKDVFENRTEVDLKDKWRNMTRQH